MTRSCVLGVDVGTSGCKAAVYDAQGRELGRGTALYPPRLQWRSRAEQDADAFWEAAKEAIREAVGPAPGPVQAIAVSSANALVAVRSDGSTIRPAILQLDRRARHEGAMVEREVGRDRLVEITGNWLAVGPTWLPTLRWLREHEPDTIAQADHFLFPGGLVTLRMTGEAAVDVTRAATTQLMSATMAGWVVELAEAAGIDVRQLPRLYRPGETAGALQRPAALELGLAPGIPVIPGPMDSVAAALAMGLGTQTDQVLVLGTVSRVMTLSAERPVPERQQLVAPYPVGGSWLLINAAWGTGSALEWAAHLLGVGDGFGEVERLAVSAERNSARRRAVYEPGRRGPEIGRRVWSVPGGRVVGEANASKRDAALAVVQGVAEILASQVAQAAPVKGREAKALRVCGGGARSAALCRAIRDRLGQDLLVADRPLVEPLGAAILAAVVGGLGPSIDAAVQEMAIREAVMTRVGRSRVREPASTKRGGHETAPQSVIGQPSYAKRMEE